MADILIRGMEMPTEKEEARLILITHDGRAVDPHCDEYEVIEVPDHGRCVDADALTKQFLEDNTYFTNEIEYEIKTAPTVIPAEEGE